MFSFFILFPVLVFIYTFLIARYRKKERAFGIAADVTTFFLFFSVSNAFLFVFNRNIVFLLIVGALVFATITTYKDWNTKSEIEIVPLLRRIWRFLFLLLCVIYAFTWLIGVIQYVLYYISK